MRESLVLFGFFIRSPQGLKTKYEERTPLIVDITQTSGFETQRFDLLGL